MWTADLTRPEKERHAFPDRAGAARDRLWRGVSSVEGSDRTGTCRAWSGWPRRPDPVPPVAPDAPAISRTALVGRHDEASLVRPTAHRADRDLLEPQSERSPDRVSGQELRCDRTDHRQDGKHGLRPWRDPPARYPGSRRQRGHPGSAYNRLGDDERGNPARVRQSKSGPGLSRCAGPTSTLEATDPLRMAGRSDPETSSSRRNRRSAGRRFRS